MLLNLEQFTKATSDIDRILFAEGEINLKSEIEKCAENITDIRTKKEFYQHINTLFLNVLLNRLDSVGKLGEQRTIEARKILVKLIQSI